MTGIIAAPGVRSKVWMGMLVVMERGYLVQLLGAGAALVIGVAVFLATRPGTQPSGPGPVPSIKPVVTKVEVPEGPKEEQPSAPSARTEPAAQMLTYAENYANEHPEEYAKVVERFREVERNGKGTVEAMKAKDTAEAWQRKWEGVAEAEFEKRRTAAAGALKAWKFQDAEAVWRDFPQGLRVTSVEPKIKAELASIEEALNGLAKALEEEANPLLVKEPELLSAEEVQAVSTLLKKAENVPEGLPEDVAHAIKALAEKLQALLDECEAVAAAKAQEAFDEFWGKYESLIKRKEFDQAVKLCESAEEDLRRLIVPKWSQASFPAFSDFFEPVHLCGNLLLQAATDQGDPTAPGG